MEHCSQNAILLALWLASASAWADLTVRVRCSETGVPQIQVNGRPVPPRMFWGREGSVPLVADAEWTDFKYEFTAFGDESGTVHVRFGADGAGRVEFRDLHVTDVETGEEFAGEWLAWPRTYAANVRFSGTALTVEIPERLPKEDFHVYTARRSMRRGTRYRIVGAVRADDKRVVKFGAYLVDEKGVHEPMTLIGSDPFPREIALASAAGVNFVSYEVPKSAWTDDETYDFAEVVRISDKVLKANPKALLLPRVKIETCGWWARRHPDHQIVYDDGSKPGVPCISSRLYREKAVKFLSAFTRYMCEKYPENFAGVHPGAQNSSEWFYWNAWGHPLNGYDPATLESWRAWCAARGDLDAVKAEVPSAASRRDVSRGLLRDPVADRTVIEFGLFQQAEMADFMAAVAKACRAASDGKKLVVFFYGYPWEFSGHSQGPAVTGHLGLQRLLDTAAGDIDILCSPVSYSDRAWGECGLTMSAAETVMRHGVLWLHEDDTRTCLEPDKAANANWGVCRTMQETQEVLRRNTAQGMLRGFGCWWMDLPSSGWFDSPDLWSEMCGLACLDWALLAQRTPFGPEVAAIADERSLLAVACGTATGRSMGAARKHLASAGAPFGQYLMSDVLRNGLSVRLQVFQSAFFADAETVAAVAAQRAARPDVTRVWCWAPGYLTAKGANVAGVEALTGFKAKLVSLPNAKVRTTAAGRVVGLPDAWGEDGAVNPLLAVETEPDDEVWATFADGSPAIVLRGKEVFAGAPDWCTELVRALERRAGVHLYLRAGEASVWAAEGWLSFHALEDGELVLDTGSSSDVFDYYTGERIATGPLVTLAVRRGETRVLRISQVKTEYEKGILHMQNKKSHLHRALCGLIALGLSVPLALDVSAGSAAVGYHQTGGVNVPQGETAVLTDEVLLGDGGVFSKTGAGTLDVPLSKVDRQVGGWEIRSHAGEMYIEAGDDTTASEAPAVIAEKAALWLRADDKSTFKDGETQLVTKWIDVRDIGQAQRQHVCAKKPDGVNPPELVEKDGTAALYFGGNGSGTYMTLSESGVSNIRQAYVVHGVYDCWGAVLGNTGSSAGMIPDVSTGSVAAGSLTRHLTSRLDLLPAYSAGRFHLDGVELDPFTVPPQQGFQLLEAEFPAQPDAVNQLFRCKYGSPQGGDYVSEIILFTNVVSETERLEVERYLLRKWSLPRTAGRPVAYLPAPGKVTAVAGSVVEFHADADKSLPVTTLQGDGIFKKTGAGTLELGPTDVMPFSGTFLWDAGTLFSRGGRPPAVKASSGDKFNGSVYTPYAIEATRTPLVDIEAGAKLTRTADAGAGTVVKTGNDWVRVNEIDEDVMNLEVNEGVFALESKSHETSGCTSALPLSVTIPNADFELPFTSTKENGTLEINLCKGNGWTGTGCYISCLNDKFDFIGGVRPPSGSQVVVLRRSEDASTKVALPADGWYELTVRAKCRFGTGKTPRLFSLVTVKFGKEGGALQDVGNLWPSGVGFGRYAFTLPEVTAGTYDLKFVSTPNGADAFVALDDVEIHALARPPETATFKVPNGDFEQIDPGVWSGDNSTAGDWTGVLSTVNAIPTGWTIDASSSRYPAADVAGTVGVASPAISPEGGVTMVCGLGNLIQGTSRLFFFDQNGKASTTFTIPAGRYRLRADMARSSLEMKLGGGVGRKSREDIPKFSASIAMGGRTVDLGTVDVAGYLAQRTYLPNELVVPEAQEVTLTVSQTRLGGVGWMDNLEFVSDADFSDRENLLCNAGAEEDNMPAWTRTADTSYFKNSTVWIRDYDQTAKGTTKYYGYSAFEGKRYFYINSTATMSQRVTVPAAGLYRFTCHAKTRADSEYYCGNNLQVWYKAASGSATNFVDTLLMHYTGNFLERSWLVRFDAAGEYDIGISGLGVAGAGQNADRESHLDGLSLRKVAGAVDDVPQTPDCMKVAVADGARLVLDFPGVKRVRALRLGGRKIPTGIVGANDYPEYLGGIGRLEIVSGGLMLLVR